MEGLSLVGKDIIKGGDDWDRDWEGKGGGEGGWGGDEEREGEML